MRSDPDSKYPVRVDLGCGSATPSGFIGLDRFQLPGVALIANLDRPLPFADNSVDLVLASHSLEHVHDLLATMREVYRVCRHGAQVCIVAPYAQMGLNLANPFHKQAFNEHTPRFWTSSITSPIDVAEYFHPHAASWGLAESDHSPADVDFRCLRLEFFYFPEYWPLAPEEQRAARKRYSDVCDQLMYHLVVVKQPMSEAQMNDLAQRMDYYDPPYVALRRAHEQTERLGTEVKQLRSTLGERENELSELRRAHDQRMSAAQAALQAGEARYQRLLHSGQRLSQEVAALRDSRWARLRRRLRPHSDDLSMQVALPFQQLKDDSLIFQDVRGYALRLSNDLCAHEYVSYPLALTQLGLTAVLLALVLDWPAAQGVLGLELVSPDVRIVAHLTMPLARAPEDKPVRFDFSPLPASAPGAFELRIFVREATAPVRVFEWQKYDFGGLGKLRRRIFCGLIFGHG